jgi:outer membrane protein assembly factor BamB
VPLLILLSLSAAAGFQFAAAEDWPNWRGPRFDGVSNEKLPDKLPDEPSVVWKAKVGTGFSTVSVARGRVFTMGNANGTDTVWCLDAATGELIWKHDYPCELDPLYYEGGPGATPTVHGDSVFTLSKKGHAFRLNFETGAVRWSRDLVGDHGFELPEWSFASSPFIFEERIILNVGGAGTALDYETGRTIWKSSEKPSGYATAVPFHRNDKPELILFVAKEVIGLDPLTGRVAWSFASECSRNVNAADPVVSGNRFMISSSVGAVCLEVGPGANPTPTVIWETKKLRTYFNPTVRVGDHLFALHGTTHRPTELVCLDWKTGETRWNEPGFGSGALMAAPDRLILFDNGELTIFPANAERFEPLTRSQILSGKCWTVPVWSNDRIYCRNAEGDLACVALR